MTDEKDADVIADFYRRAHENGQCRFWRWRGDPTRLAGGSCALKKGSPTHVESEGVRSS